MLILFLNFNQILNLDYYILCSSDKGVITPLSELQKIPNVTQAISMLINIYIYLFTIDIYLFKYSSGHIHLFIIG